MRTIVPRHYDLFDSVQTYPTGKRPHFFVTDIDGTAYINRASDRPVTVLDLNLDTGSYNLGSITARTECVVSVDSGTLPVLKPMQPGDILKVRPLLPTRTTNSAAAYGLDINKLLLAGVAMPHNHNYLHGYARLIGIQPHSIMGREVLVPVSNYGLGPDVATRRWLGVGAVVEERLSRTYLEPWHSPEAAQIQIDDALRRLNFIRTTIRREGVAAANSLHVGHSMGIVALALHNARQHELALPPPQLFRLPYSAQLLDKPNIEGM